MSQFFFYFIIYKIDKEYYEYKTKQNHTKPHKSLAKKLNFDLGSSPLVLIRFRLNFSSDKLHP